MRCKMQFYTVVKRLRGGKFVSSVNQRLGRFYSLSENNVFDKQKRLLSKTLKYTSKHVPYYNQLLSDKKDLNIFDFPIVSKKLISENYRDFLSERINRYVCTEGYTGGSTGEPFHIILNGGYEYHFGLRKWRTYGYCKNDTILAMDGSKLPNDLIENNIFWNAKNKDAIPFGNYLLSSLYLTDENAECYCRFLFDLKPKFIRGYPSFIYSVACYAKEKNINLNGFCKGIELTSENAYKYQIEFIKSIYGCPVYLQYGHAEACVFGFSVDDTYVYRIEPLYGYVEVVDENGNHVKEGKVGEVVVTTLHNRALPLIRYRTGDYAEYGGMDARYIYLNKVLGRTQDYIINRENKKVLLTALIFGQHNSAMRKILKWQMEQFEIGKINLHIIKTEEYCEKDEISLRDMLKKLGNVSVEFDYTDNIPVTPRGKSKMLIQHLNYNLWNFRYLK